MSTVCVKFHSEKVLMLTDCVLNNSRPNLTSDVMFRTRRNQTDREEIKCWSDRIFKAACGWVCEIVNFYFIFLTAVLMVVCLLFDCGAKLQKLYNGQERVFVLCTSQLDECCSTYNTYKLQQWSSNYSYKTKQRLCMYYELGVGNFLKCIDFFLSVVTWKTTYTFMKTLCFSPQLPGQTGCRLLDWGV